MKIILGYSCFGMFVPLFSTIPFISRDRRFLVPLWLFAIERTHTCAGGIYEAAGPCNIQKPDSITTACAEQVVRNLVAKNPRHLRSFLRFQPYQVSETRLEIKRNDWLLVDMCPQAANHCALF